MQISISTSLALPRFIAVADSGGGDVTWTNPDIANASYDSVFFSVASQETNPHKMWIKDDGLKMYVLGVTGDDINEYSLSTAWDITTASHTAATSVASQEASPHGFFFKSDGTKMYLTGSSGDDVNEYDLTTAWDSTTLSHVQAQSVSTQDSAPQDIWFNTDGTKMFVVGFSGKDVNEYSLSTAWDVSTISYTRNFSVSAQANGPRGMFMNPDGTKMWITENTSDEVHEYDLTTGFDLSTASYNDVQFDVSSQESLPFGVSFKNDGSKMYIIGGGNDTIFQYSTVAPVWTDPDINNASYDSVSFSITTQESTPAGVIFKDDGTKMYIIGTNADAVLQYGLSTAWDLSTASYDSASADVSGQEDAPRSVFFKDDGTSFYIVGTIGDAVYQYNMTTAWNLSTASYASKSADVSGQEASPRCVRFKSDGTSFYICGTGSDAISQYDMTTAWDVSTASYASKQLDVSAQEASPFTFDFSPNGDKVWLVGTSDTVREYTLSTAWDISTGSHESSVSFTTSNEDATAISMTFKSDGSKMYLLGAATDTVYQYST